MEVIPDSAEPTSARGRLPMSLAVMFESSYLGLVRLAAAFVGERPLAEDIVQEVFGRVHAHPPKLNDPDAAARYLRVSVLNASRNAVRARGRRAARDRTADTFRADHVDSAEQSALELLRKGHVRASVMTLPARQRDVIILRFLSDLSIAETARTLGISQGAVKASTTRALKCLSQLLGGSDDL